MEVRHEKLSSLESFKDNFELSIFVASHVGPIGYRQDKILWRYFQDSLDNVAFQLPGTRDATREGKFAQQMPPLRARASEPEADSTGRPGYTCRWQAHFRAFPGTWQRGLDNSLHV
jgi:hypothetical protein